MDARDSRDALDFAVGEEEVRFQEWKDKCENLSGEDLEKFKEWQKQFN